MTYDPDGLPGQDTLLACWDALTRLWPPARLTGTDGAVAAVFPSWAPLNNAILLGKHDRTSEARAAAGVRSIFEQARIPAWALWRPSPIADLDTPDTAGQLEELKRDTTTLVMQATLASGLRSSDAVVPAPIAAVARFDEDAQLTQAELGSPDDVPGLAGWALVHDGVVASAAWSFVHETDCGVFAVETLPRFRRRGFARVLTEHLLAAAHREGATTASLQSTRMGQPLYESLGFTAVGRYEEWIWK
jgi:GNAT superfamily N-acetyltransferase